MARLLEPFPVVPLKLLAIDAIADRNVSLQFPAGSAQATFPGAAHPLVQPTGRPRALFADTDGWHHGGINE